MNASPSRPPTGRSVPVLVLVATFGAAAVVTAGVLVSPALSGSAQGQEAVTSLARVAPAPATTERAPVSAEVEPSPLLTAPLLDLVTPPPPPSPVLAARASGTEKVSRSGPRAGSSSGSGSGSPGGSGTTEPASRRPSGGGGSTASQVVALVNAARADAGCGAVSSDGALTAAAQGHSADMAANDYFSHTGQDGRTFADRIRAAGYAGGAIAENIAAGQPDASSVMASWMDSAGHRANILNCAFSDIGVGVASGGSMGTYWTQTFGS